ncbi:ribbon-helix-helix protein, CopG family [Corynebacterium sp. 22KM0430]|uniref:ribbon-helix-helix protein, CopG family n=1 Tax=unclassified Corynebacterium TaxID=2624378 RepID=UPI0039AF1196
MVQKKNRLADTIRKPDPHSVSVPVAETLREAKESQLTRRTTVYLSDPTWKAIKHAAVEEGTNVSQILERLIKNHISSN